VTAENTTDSIRWATDDLGNVASLTIQTSIYSKIAIFKTAYWFTDRWYLFLSKPPPGAEDTVQVEIRSKSSASKDELIVMCREFANNLIDQQIRQEVIAETGNVRDSLIKKAFFEGNQTLYPANLTSNEAQIPTTDQSYKHDPLRIGRATGS
jgi:His-Xaa-Ser system protein HxsD